MSINNYFDKKYVPFIVIMTAFLIVHYFVLDNVVFAPGDDMNFQKIVDNHSYFDFISSRYETWTGRIVIESLLYSAFSSKKGLIIWKLTSLFVYFIYVLSLTLIAKSVVGEVASKYRYFIVFLVACWPYLLFYPTFNQGITWFTGSFNYFYPFVAGCVVLLFIVKTLMKQTINRWFYGVVVVFTLYASNQEQMGLLLTTLMLLLSGYYYLNKDKAGIKWWIILLLLILGMLLATMAPGNELRYNVELRWFKEVDYTAIPLLRKLILGMEYTVQYYLLKSPISLFLISIPLLSIAIVKKDFNLIFNSTLVLICFTVAAYFSVETLDQIGNPTPVWKLMFDKQLPYEVSSLLLILSVLLLVLLIPYCIFSCFESKEKGIFIALLFIGGMCTAFILGFSPTIFGSGFRIFFISEMLLGIIAAGLFLELFRISKSRVINGIAIFIGFIVMLVYTIEHLKTAFEPFVIRYF